MSCESWRILSVDDLRRDDDGRGVVEQGHLVGDRHEMAMLGETRRHEDRTCLPAGVDHQLADERAEPHVEDQVLCIRATGRKNGSSSTSSSGPRRVGDAHDRLAGSPNP